MGGAKLFRPYGLVVQLNGPFWPFQAHFQVEKDFVRGGEGHKSVPVEGAQQDVGIRWDKGKTACEKCDNVHGGAMPGDEAAFGLVFGVDGVHAEQVEWVAEGECHGDPVGSVEDNFLLNRHGQPAKHFR